MVAISLYDNYAGTYSANAQSSSATGAVRWISTQDGWVTAFRWRRETGVTTPTNMRLWDTVTQSAVASITSMPAPTGTGWQTVALASPVFVFANREYRISFFQGASTSNVVANVSTAPLPPSPLSFVLTGGLPGAVVVGSDAYPNGALGVTWFAYDVIWTDTDPGTGAPPTSATVNNSLAAWFSSGGDNTHHADLPWLVKAAVDEIRLATGNTPGQLDATKAVSDTIHDLLTSANKNLGTLWDLAGHLTELELAAWKALFGAGSARLTGTNSAGGSAFYTSDGQLVSQLIAEIWQRVRVLRNDVPFGLGDWTMTAETDFVDAIAFAEPADAYVLTITSWQDTQPADASPAGTWLHRLGWWCVLTGSMASSRAFVEFAGQLLTDNGRRMAGCAIQLQPGTVAHVQAWLLA